LQAHNNNILPKSKPSLHFVARQFTVGKYGRYEPMKKLLTILILLLSFPLIAENKGKEALPSDVYSLFYAIKNSLDYGYIEGVSEPNFPKKELVDYRRVGEESLTRLRESYVIETYEASKEDYILILASKSGANKYKATRMTMSYLKDNEWIELGGYYYE
jgi:hypothetical protein